MSVILDDIVTALLELPGEAIAEIKKLIDGARASDDPVRFIQRRGAADASHAATQAAVKAALAKTAPKSQAPKG